MTYAEKLKTYKEILFIHGIIPSPVRHIGFKKLSVANPYNSVYLINDKLRQELKTGNDLIRLNRDANVYSGMTFFDEVSYYWSDDWLDDNDPIQNFYFVVEDADEPIGLEELI